MAKNDKTPKASLLHVPSALALALFLFLTLALPARSDYAGIFAADFTGEANYIDGPFPFWINPDYANSTTAVPLGAKTSFDDCLDCYYCCCTGQRCSNVCEWCREDYWYDCPPYRPSRSPLPSRSSLPSRSPSHVPSCSPCVVPPVLSCSPCPAPPAPTQPCALQRPVIGNGEARPQVDTVVFEQDDPSGVALIPNTPYLQGQASVRTLNYVALDLTVIVTSSEAATLQLNNPGSTSNPLYTRVFSCAPASAPCTLVMCEVDTLPGIEFAVDQSTSSPRTPILAQTVTGALLFTGTIEIGSST